MTVGIYIRQLSTGIHGTPEQAARRARDHGIDFVAILISWQERGKQRMLNEDTLKRYADAFTDAGVGVQLWAYPWVDMEELLIRTFRRRTDELDGMVSGWLVDPELGYKWNATRPEGVVRLSARLLMNGLINAMDESLFLGVTSYGALQGHRNFPWDVFTAYGWQSPQVYGMKPGLLERSMDAWREAAGPNAYIVPSVGAYGAEDEQRLEGWLEGLYCTAPDIAGVVFWSWRQISVREWPIIARFAERHRVSI